MKRSGAARLKSQSRDGCGGQELKSGCAWESIDQVIREQRSKGRFTSGSSRRVGKKGSKQRGGRDKYWKEGETRQVNKEGRQRRRKLPPTLQNKHGVSHLHPLPLHLNRRRQPKTPFPSSSTFPFAHRPWPIKLRPFKLCNPKTQPEPSQLRGKAHDTTRSKRACRVPFPDGPDRHTHKDSQTALPSSSLPPPALAPSCPILVKKLC